MQDPRKEIILNKNGAIIIIEDDEDDQDFLTETFLNLIIQTRYFSLVMGWKHLII